jgi:5-methylthioadenosine/S-adenosylhomocysteine deaminase
MSTLIQNATLVLPNRVIPNGYLLIENDRIADIGYSPLAISNSPIANRQLQIIGATNKLVLPGLINAHTHLEQTFMRGYSANRSLLDWLRNCIWKLQGAMDVEDVRLAATLGLVEAMRGGATTILNHHKVPFSKQHTDVVLQAAEKLGLRLVLARAWADKGTNAESADSILDDLKRLFSEWHGAAEGRIHIANGPLVPWRCTTELLQRSTALARAHNALTHCHISETQDEVALTLKETGMRPIEWFHSLGILGDDFHAVHGVWLSDIEIKLLAQHGATVTHCPAANMILASGAAPIAKLSRFKPPEGSEPSGGLNLALATDGPASNDGQDMFEMMRLAALLARVTTLDAQAMQPREVIDMATLGGARALKRFSKQSLGEIGRLEIGAKADLVMLDLNAAHIQPVGDVLASVVYNARGSDVDTVLVDGRVLMQNKRVLGLDEDALLDECRERAAHLAKRAGLS